MVVHNLRNGSTTRMTYAGLAGDDSGAGGRPDGRPALVLLHGLTFDRTTWRPVLDDLARVDPTRRVVALDLPGHGASPAWPAYDIESVAAGVHAAVEAAGIHAP